jgi:nucleoside phosphorylase
VRRDLFLHFLNRDTREIFGVYDLREETHRRLMRRALNAAVALCEDRCIAPPGFIIEDVMAFELAETQKAYLQASVIQFPMREHNLAEFAEKKRIGYEPMRNRYSGLFDDTRIGFLGDTALGLIHRQSHITERILEGWQAGPQSGEKIWNPVKSVLTPSDIDRIATIPVPLNDRGTALTWAAMTPELPAAAMAAAAPLRDALQHIYFKQYCAEFRLLVLSGIPSLIQDFMLPNKPKSYSYRRLRTFLDVFNLADVVLDAPADLMVALRARDGYISFMDAYVELAEQQATDTNLQFAAARAARATKYDWTSIARRRTNLFELGPLEIVEFDDALRELARILSAEHGLPTRVDRRAPPSATKKDKPIVIHTAELDLVLFVALDEELDVLAAELNLSKSHLSPAAKGRIGATPVEVICPKAMGRVPAAVSVATYLAKRPPPKLIIIVGLAGGFGENGSALGHALCVTTVVDLANRKVVDDEGGGASHKFRRHDYTMNPALNAVLTSDAFDKKAWSDDAHERFDWPQDRRPSIHSGPIASVDEVVSSDQWRVRMLSGHGGDDKLLGVEMEAGGVCAAAEQAGVPVCMLRVVSDNADPSKADDAWRRRGMRTVASLLARLPLDAVFEAIGTSRR